MAEAAHAVVQEAQDAGVWVFGGGLHSHEEVCVVATDGTVTDGPYPESKAYIGGSRLSTFPHARRRWSGLAGSPSPAVVRRRFASSCPALRPDQGHPRAAAEGVPFALRPPSPGPVFGNVPGRLRRTMTCAALLSLSEGGTTPTHRERRSTHEISAHFRWHQEHEHPQRAGRPPGQTDCRVQRPLHSHRGVRHPRRSWPRHGGSSADKNPERPMCELGWKSLGVLELTALPSIDEELWVPMVQETDVLLVNGGDPLYLCYWMRQSGLADLLPSLRDGLRGTERREHGDGPQHRGGLRRLEAAHRWR